MDILKNDLRNLLNDKRRLANDLIVSARVLQTNITDPAQLQTIKLNTDRLEQLANVAEENVEKRFVY